MYDFHTHTFLSDGVLSPLELIRRAQVQGYRVIGVTDHVGVGNLDFVVKTLVTDCALATKRWDILAVPGVEITHVPKDDIDQVAKAAKKAGAKLVIVHGETIVEPVEEGTNEAAVRSTAVDVLAHPGLITYEVARLAAENGVYLEITARKGHSLANGHVVRMAQRARATMVLDSDAHEPEDLLTYDLVTKVAEGAGLSNEETHALLQLNPQNLLAKLGFGPVSAAHS
ncbi:MAG: histidinol phosphate phosphatase domain-containing protein [Chloroflexi bacterium]|nr:histidinol phosphate phosphatase domain-containing protein [Chloroflexota bacterium]